MQKTEENKEQEFDKLDVTSQQIIISLKNTLNQQLQQMVETLHLIHLMKKLKL
jgi:hypothetical protein